MAMKITPRRVIAAGTAVLIVAATLAMVLPAGADMPTVIRLNLDGEGRFFAYGTHAEADKQFLLPVKNGCRIDDADEHLINLSPTPAGNGPAPGIGPDGIGIKASPSSGNGSPCTQISDSEVLTVGGGSALNGRRFSQLRLDLELTANAKVQLVLNGADGGDRTYLLNTGPDIPADSDPLDTTEPFTVESIGSDQSDNCAASTSSGPNSAGTDNCLWTIDPGVTFASFSLSTTRGTVSLEGSGDFGGSAAHDTLFHLSNSAPTAANDSATTAEDTSTVINVLTNDTDPDGNTLTPSVQSGPSNGSAVVNANGTITYSPSLNFNGSDSFTYRVSDGFLTSTNATVSITVTPVNDPPVPNTAGQTTDEDEPVVVTVATDVDDTDGSATCTLTDQETEAVLDGTVENGAGFTVTVTPPENYFGTMLLQCTVTDGDDSVTMETPISVGVTGVNDAPVAVDDTADVDQDVSNTSDTSVLIDVVDNDLDVEGDALTPVDIVVPAADALLGATAVEESGQIRYTPAEDFVGQATFTYKVSDGALTSADAATVTVDVVQVMCSEDTVSDEDGTVSGEFTRLTDPDACKRYEIVADEGNGTVLFAPEGGTIVKYRGFVTLGLDDAPVVGSEVGYELLLRYDQDGDPETGAGFVPVPWCEDTVLDGAGLVTSANLPDGHTWCIASEGTKSVGPAPPQLVTEWQVYGEDDPMFKR